MLNAGIADSAILNSELWESIRHHREVFTSVGGVDYTPDVRKRITLIPPENVVTLWKNDYDAMATNMIYDNNVPSFDEILHHIAIIESRFKDIL